MGLKGDIMNSVEQYLNSFYSEVEKYVEGIHILKKAYRKKDELL